MVGMEKTSCVGTVVATALKASSCMYSTLQPCGAFFAPLPYLFTAPLGIFSELFLSGIAKNWKM